MNYNFFLYDYFIVYFIVPWHKSTHTLRDLKKNLQLLPVIVLPVFYLWNP